MGLIIMIIIIIIIINSFYFLTQGDPWVKYYLGYKK